MCEVFQAAEKLEAGGGVRDCARVQTLRGEPRDDMRLGDPLKALTNEVGLPAAQLNQPGVRDAAGLGASERERDELDGATERLDRHMPAGFGPTEHL